MRTFESLLKAGYIPSNGSWLWKKNEIEPYLQFQRFNYSSNERMPIFKPPNRPFKPNQLFIHPYFPKKSIIAVKIIKSFPYGKLRMVYYLKNGELHLNGQIKYTEREIYQYPTFFQPIYEMPG